MVAEYALDPPLSMTALASDPSGPYPLGMPHAAPIILAHRGLHATAHENSLDAFQAAFDAKADGIECDLQKTAYGEYVIVHDPPSAVTVAERRGAGLATLEDMLGSLPAGAFLNLELKSDTLGPSDCQPIYEALSRRPAPGPLLVSSFDPRLLPYFKARRVPIGLLIGEKAAGLGLARMAYQLLRLRPDYINLPILMFKVIGKCWGLVLARTLRALGFSLAFWTVNGTEEALLVGKLARIVITDQVRNVQVALGPYSSKGRSL